MGIEERWILSIFQKHLSIVRQNQNGVVYYYYGDDRRHMFFVNNVK